MLWRYPPRAFNEQTDHVSLRGTIGRGTQSLRASLSQLPVSQVSARSSLVFEMKYLREHQLNLGVYPNHTPDRVAQN